MNEPGIRYAIIPLISLMLVACDYAVSHGQSGQSTAGPRSVAPGTQPAAPDPKTPQAMMPTQEPGAPAKAASSSTLDNLQTAFNGESNAHARYLAFAGKADEEGYGAVASLFRAAAHAEQIHARHHAEVIKALGAAPKADVKPPEVKSTAENLKVAIAGESYERDVMYPQFIAKAKADGNSGALRSFNYARAAEAGHAKLYQEAADNLAGWKGGPRDFYVCSVCGNTVMKIDFAKCPVCRQSKDNYQKVA